MFKQILAFLSRNIWRLGMAYS